VTNGERVEGGRIGPLRPDFAPAACHQLLLRQGRDATTLALDGVAMGSLPPTMPSQGRLGLWTSQAGVSAAGVALTALP
jgi:hypothetical protein